MRELELFRRGNSMREQMFMGRVAMFCNGIFPVVFFVWLVANTNGLHGFERRKIGIDPGPSVIATKGEVWPKPQFKITSDGFFIVRPNIFQFKVVGENCDILEKALQRYNQDLKSFDKSRRSIKLLYQNETRRRFLRNDDNFKGYLDELSVDLRSPCESLPHAEMDERYELRINTEDFPHQGFLFSQSIWGVLRGLETWSQLIYSPSDHNALIINSTSIMDFPKFPHRGLLIDTSRHFLPIKTIYSMLDAMVMSKLNVLHWHIVDDQSFPYQSKTFPDLSDKGAYAFTHVYSPTHVQNVIAYASLRGIRVIPEFDTPGHTRSWGEAYPELLTKCYDRGEPDGSLGPMNPVATETYSFMEKMLREITETFPDRYVHLGGDEVEFQCWATNPQIRQFMKENNLTPRGLEGIFVNKVIKIATNFSAVPIVWQEVFDDGVALPNNTLIQIWKGDYHTKLNEITAKGYKTLLSSCWYLDSLSSGGDWTKFYNCDPHEFHGSEYQKKLVIGGEACMWGEVVDANNVISRTWPRACAAAEKLWSSISYLNIEDAGRRLEEHTCRMNRRKIPAQPPNGPGYCPFELPDKKFSRKLLLTKLKLFSKQNDSKNGIQLGIRLGEKLPGDSCILYIKDVLLSIEYQSANQVHPLTGVQPTLRGIYKLKDFYHKTLRALEKLPKDSAYRRNTETIVCYRLSVVDESETICEIENNICCGSMEMLIRQAAAEYELARKMCVWKPWEPLTQKPPPGQWKWPPLVK